jgi:hypothetical protein
LHKAALTQAEKLLEYQNVMIAIHTSHNKLIVSLLTAVEKGGIIDKEATSHDDLFDTFRMSLLF